MSLFIAEWLHIMAFELSGFCHVYLIILKIKAWKAPSHSHELKNLQLQY